ncbi:uncharacterized protein LOC134537237 [Bacillus rossius redtenbacheri]|uniref:uncharacterized protein LOC134537237 n=1 Tax=Bacillus rossius redtenbacheri TaxID=93214 RepID=UPI002FDEAA26
MLLLLHKDGGLAAVCRAETSTVVPGGEALAPPRCVDGGSPRDEGPRPVARAASRSTATALPGAHVGAGGTWLLPARHLLLSPGRLVAWCAEASLPPPARVYLLRRAVRLVASAAWQRRVVASRPHPHALWGQTHYYCYYCLPWPAWPAFGDPGVDAFAATEPGSQVPGKRAPLRVDMETQGSPIMGFTCGRLRRVGLWTGDGDSRLHGARPLLATANVYAVVALLTGVFFKQPASRSALVENTGNILTVAPCCVAAVRLWRRGPAFRAAVQRLRAAMSGAEEEEAELVRATAAEERRIARAYTAVVCGTALCYFARPLADLAAGRRDPALPFRMWPLLPRSCPARFAAEYSVQLACVLACVVTMAAVDSFTLALVKCSALQFRVLGASLQALGRGKEESFEQRLQFRVRQHQDMLANTKNIADLLSPLLFTHYIVSSAAICMVGYRVSATSQLSELLISIGQLTCIVYRLFLLSYFSSEVMHQSLAVNDAAYSCRWYLVDKRAKMMLALMIGRAQSPAVMRTGKFGVLSLEIFFKLIQGAYSYYALLKKLSST